MEWKFKPKDLKVKKVLSDVISQEIDSLQKLSDEEVNPNTPDSNLGLGI